VIPLTSLAEIQWPAIPAAGAAQLLALLFQLDETQYWTPEALSAWQFRQLARVIEHAWATVPYYRRRFEEAGLNPAHVASPERWSNVPLLSRRDIQSSGDQLHSRAVPPAHGQVSHSTTSGSTNAPVVTLGTDVTAFFWRALTVRDHLWHRRDLRQSLATIRYTGDARGLPPEGLRATNWGGATEQVFETGPAYLLNIRCTVDEQADWLRRVNTGYVLSYPSVLLAIARRFEAHGWTLPNLVELRTFGEILEPVCRATCQRVFRVPVVDMYSSQEVGYIALQCHEHAHYHVQSENLLVEILDGAGRPCEPGQTGRVVVTTLHNFAMPLLRYDIGDYAEAGEPCPCGRGLPVIRRVLGRQRNLLVMPDGSRRWPVFTAGERPEALPPFHQFQVIQRSRQDIEVLVVRPADFTTEEEGRVKRYMQQTLGHPFAVTLRRVAEIARSPSGKFEDFICELA
jgi:phenylacetate-CoA ligase